MLIAMKAAQWRIKLKRLDSISIKLPMLWVFLRVVGPVKRKANRAQ